VTIGSRVIGALARLPKPETQAVAVERDIEAKMPDGAVLLADRWYPSDRNASDVPVVLMRSPYGRRQIGIIGRLFAERGYQVVIQSCRGTFGSGGEWVPLRNELDDGRATLEWLSSQPWFSGTTATFGPSYLGLTQWAIAKDAPAHVKAMAPQVTAAMFRDPAIYPGDAFALETALTWVHQVEHQELGGIQVLRSNLRARRELRDAYRALPLGDADRQVVGRHVDFFQEWLEHDEPGDPWWDAIDFRAGVDTAPPSSMVGGWYDVFLPWQVADYERAVAAGRTARLTIGPWAHTNIAGTAEMLRDGLEWFDVQLRGRPPRRSTPVRLFVMGSKKWVDRDAWPPSADAQRWHLHPGGRLDRAEPRASTPDRYRYDPTDPTPGIGGTSLDRKNNGPKDQHAREERADVLTYTSDVLTRDVTVIGPLVTDLYVRPSSEHVDYFVRLCDVSPKGRSVNLSDGVVRLRPDDIDRASDGSCRVRISMWPTANTFLPGHRIRLQVSSGAHPLVARNTGGGEPIRTATALVAVDHEVLHDPDHPSSIELPIA
jgi:putative CocE/NonD family hydrolase